MRFAAVLSSRSFGSPVCPAVSLSPIEIEDPMVSTPLKCQQEREEKLEITINEPQSALSIRHILVPYIIAWTGSLNAFGLEYQRQRWATVVVHLCVEFRFGRFSNTERSRTERN